MHIQINANKRDAQGTGASRRLRRAGRLPGIIYGGNSDAVSITLDHNELYHQLRKEAFHSSLLNISVDGKKESVILRNAQWHPFKQQVLHVDFLRVNAKEKLYIKVPLHFINGDISPAVKLSAGMISHVISEMEVSCLPADIPEFIEVDLKDLTADASVHISHITLPKGVEVVQHGDTDPVVVTVLKTGGGEEEGAGDASTEGGGAASAV